MDVDQDNDGSPVAAEGGGPVPIELKMYRASREGRADLLQQLFKDKRAGITPEACKVYEHEGMEHDEEYYDEFEVDDNTPYWTCLHKAAFNDHAECVKILLRERIVTRVWDITTSDITVKAFDESTPLMVACANLPYTAECIK